MPTGVLRGTLTKGRNRYRCHASVRTLCIPIAHNTQCYSKSCLVRTQCNSDSDKRNSHSTKLDKVAVIVTQKAVYMREDACSLRRYLRSLEEATTIQFTDRRTLDTS